MTIGEVINHYGREHSPYMRGLVNHLPMGQLALYKISDDLDKVKTYSWNYNMEGSIEKVRGEYAKKQSLEDCLGQRPLYESCLAIIQEKREDKDIHNLVREVLNKYKLGMSSGVFHTLIRLAYGLEGYNLDKSLDEEIERGLAYYITAYREADLFNREIPGHDIIKELEDLTNIVHIRELILEKETLGQRLRALYRDTDYLKLGFIIEGNPDDKIRALLDLLITAYSNVGSIVILHCITALHALIVLREYFDDYSEAIDILTTCIITHLLSIGYREDRDNIEEVSQLSWDCLLAKGSESTDVHAIKLTYTAYELYKIYKIPELKNIALKRIHHR